MGKGGTKMAEVRGKTVPGCLPPGSLEGFLFIFKLPGPSFHVSDYDIVIFNSFTEMLFTIYIIHPLKVYNSMLLL